MAHVKIVLLDFGLANLYAALAMVLTQDDLQVLGEEIDKRLEKQSRDFDQKLATLKTGILQEMDSKLEITTTAILGGVRSYLESNIIPLLRNHEQRIERLEKHLDLPPVPSSGQ